MLSIVFLIKKINPKIEFDFLAPNGAVLKDGAAKGSPLKSQVSRFLIPNKTHRKAELLVAVEPVEVTGIAAQVAEPCVI